MIFKEENLGIGKFVRRDADWGGSHRIFRLAFSSRRGIINASDLATLRRAIISDYQNNAQFDPSGDGNITVIDLVRLKKYLAKIGG